MSLLSIDIFFSQAAANELQLFQMPFRDFRNKYLHISHTQLGIGISLLDTKLNTFLSWCMGIFIMKIIQSALYYQLQPDWWEWPKSNLCCQWTELPKELLHKDHDGEWRMDVINNREITYWREMQQWQKNSDLFPFFKYC